MDRFEPDEADFFTDLAVCADPYPYLEGLRGRGPVSIEPHHQVVMVARREEALAIYNDSANFSACNAAAGPFPPLPFVPDSDDISADIAAFRDQMPSADLLITYDRPEHAPARSLLLSLFTPRRLAENETYLRGLCTRMTEAMLAKGTAEVVSELGSPYATLVIADLLGIPEEDREIYRDRLTGAPGGIGEEAELGRNSNPLEFLHESFTAYIEQRRAAPKGDVLSDLANAAYPDGSVPATIEVVRVAVNLFAAGQETTARLLATTLRILAEQPELQARLRAEPAQIPAFVEEALRLEGPVKGTFRLARRTTTIGGVEIRAGATVMNAIATINRDPALYERPDEIMLDRPRIREHFAFGRGVHTCPGASLARVEVRVMLERLLEQTASISISEMHHGKAGERRFDYVPTYLLRGLNALHLVFAPHAGAAV